MLNIHYTMNSESKIIIERKLLRARIHQSSEPNDDVESTNI